ncbi:hypothetical protein CN1A_61 [Clavibacter phage CN1A]|uniref:Uncharacterized protein n=1 Tax=Clavibacter phage CN1A TaxID=1406793 RepID=U5PT98_9CAUD|nr:hypothetical protein CN1A_61 [Clavibacter phage CN1A]AGY47170.1 hypothetical protein CN1A_61 [Clavibacter phage CN1A]
MTRRWGGFLLGIPAGAVALILIDYLIASIRFHHEQAEFEREWSTSDWKKPARR